MALFDAINPSPNPSPAPLSQAGGFTIEEVTGSKRSLTLRGRALPYQGVAWEGSQRTKLIWYSGNPVATQQVLGPEESTTEITGIFKDRFLEGQIESTNFAGQIQTAAEACAALDQLRISGNALRVQWGPFVRNGILRRFRAEVDRIEDIRWTCEFEWSGRDDQVGPKGAAPSQGLPNTREALNGIDDVLAIEPLGLAQAYRAQLVTAIQSVRRQAGTVLDAARTVASLTRSPAEVLGAVASATEAIRFESDSISVQLLDTPRSLVSSSDRLADVVKQDVWRRTLAYRVARFLADTQRQERRLQKAARPGALQIVTVPEGSSLRQIALRVYGNADSWQVIADVNGLEGSVVPAGTVLIIPPPPSSSATARTGGVQGGAQSGHV